MIVIGLTGSIGMGKSTTAQMFRDLGVPVHDADATVHRLYSGPAVNAVKQLFPGTIRENQVDRKLLSQIVLADADAMKSLEAIIHPLVREAEEKFRQKAIENDETLIVLDIPLLFETGAQERVDKIVVVSAGPRIQRQRVLDRPEMTEEKFNAILAKQVPDEKKRQLADFVVDTSKGFEFAREQIRAIIRQLEPGRPDIR